MGNILDKFDNSNEIINLDFEKNEKTNDNISITEILEKFSKSYDTLNNESKMMRIQKNLYKKVFKLKMENISNTTFLNFAIYYVFASKDLDTIIKFLKKPK